MLFMLTMEIFSVVKNNRSAREVSKHVFVLSHKGCHGAF